uniref:Uncharacterized protein AlNc14C248G9591 n=1 Tax=Albugo laibachii Nc14 TaxID=890382 RepID=F0WTA6_9STRA|nr:conserved hypothetical protein [Albugo laibachii Nc14]|eukprot:CCA24595.1 conserved hypothetical protein [Albugo laibachii Nc14]
MAVKEYTVEQGYWILDSGSSRHLANDLNLLEDVEDCASECVAPDGRTLRITKRGTVKMTTVVMDGVERVQLSNVHYAENLQGNIISYGLLEGKGYGIAYHGSQLVVAGINGGPPVFNVETMNNILVVRVQDCGNTRRDDGVPMALLSQNEIEQLKTYR